MFGTEWGSLLGNSSVVGLASKLLWILVRSPNSQRFRARLAKSKITVVLAC